MPAPFFDEFQKFIAFFSENEIAYLQKKGRKIDRLVSGTLPAEDEDQRQFLAVARDCRPAKTLLEVLWQKIQVLRDVTREAQELRVALEASIADRNHFKSKLASNTGLVDSLYEEIKGLKAEGRSKEKLVRELRQKLLKHEPPTEPAATGAPSYLPCHQCQSYGGPNGSCPRCGGTGFEP